MLSESVVLLESFLPFIDENCLAIDCGIVTAKIVFMFQNDNHQNSLRSLTVINEKLESFLCEIQKEFDRQSIVNIYLTGFKILSVREMVKSIFNIDAILVDEISAVRNGFDLVSKNMKLPDIEYKHESANEIENIDKYKVDINNPMIKQFIKAMQIKTEGETTEDDESIKVPNILIMAGSTVKFYLVKNDKSVQKINSSFCGGETLRGLCKCMVDSNNYVDVMEKANKGNRENTDTQVWEVMSDNEKSPYGKMPPHLPIFSFGKSADYNKGKEHFSSDDILESLCNLFYNETMIQTIQLCKTFKLKTVYFYGGMYKSAVFLKFLQMRNKIFGLDMKIKVIDCDYLLALGAMKKE